MTKPTSKIIQIATLPQGKTIKPSFVALCEDGSIWNMIIEKDNVNCDWKCVLRMDLEGVKDGE